MVLVRVRVLMLDMVGIFGVTVLVVVMLGASGALMVSLTVRVGVRVLVTGVVGIFGVDRARARCASSCSHSSRHSWILIA